MTLISPRIDCQIAMESVVWNNDIDLRSLCEKILSEAVSLLLSKQEKSFCEVIEVSLVFTDAENIKALNAQYRQIDRSTNVLSFPSFFALSGETLGPILGDVIFAYEVIKIESEILGEKLEDHLKHLIIHGFLHLLGYDHIDDEDACIMEELERCILAKLGIYDPYAVRDLS
ncbi:rRNA maturation RNase YbeY [Candidatus Liberibacter sp.]|uniref:rRNA maturation RNase YbeY n=1 Tax=Candidatus Liberibacter sp. TaxID=34022 RepID=UPI0015F57CA0|nr:rRNA maturation RNase YbeY [Candidatus Liberibacter sp.]MBA5724102.1 rRNA maturation RNase YbeY [Candidatus Liberibacter sp.]